MENQENENVRISRNAFKEWLEKLQQESWQLKQDSITRIYSDQILEEKKNKITNTKQALLYLNEVLIDEIPYSDSLTCNFYVHPNMGERGLLCYFPLDALSDGPHLMHLNKKLYGSKMDSLSSVLVTEIPFFINKN